MAKLVISTDKLSKSFIVKKSEIEAVKDVSIDIYEKEFVCIIGPSGCGKTTLLEMIGGIQDPTSGSITINGTICAKGFPKELRRRIGFVYQNENLLPWRTVEKNLRLPLEIFNMVDEETPKRIEEALDLVGLKEYSSVFPQELSGGMKQRVTIARALIYDPDILLMDQPFGALDAITRRMLVYDFLNIWHKTQKTFVMVTNNVDEALLCGTRIIVLSECPARVIETVDVDIPYEQRHTDMTLLPRYQELFNKIQTMIKI